MARLSLQVTDNSREEVGNVADDDGNAGNGSTSSFQENLQDGSGGIGKKKEELD